jgi:hypothetical protein
VTAEKLISMRDNPGDVCICDWLVCGLGKWRGREVPSGLFGGRRGTCGVGGRGIGTGRILTGVSWAGGDVL